MFFAIVTLWSCWSMAPLIVITVEVLGENTCLILFFEADVHYGKLARLRMPRVRMNLNALKEEKSTTQLVNPACLWRGQGIENYQRTHADSDPGHYHMVIPLTMNYEIVMCPGTHWHVERKRSNSTDAYIFSVTASEAQWLKLNFGDILMFCSNTVHHGSTSSSSWQENHMLSYPFKDQIHINWFPGSKKDAMISNIAILHAGLENWMIHKSISSPLDSFLSNLKIRGRSFP